MRTKHCSKCGKRIDIIVTDSGERIVVDHEVLWAREAENGSETFVRIDGRVLRGERMPFGVYGGVRAFKPHRWTCRKR